MHADKSAGTSDQALNIKNLLYNLHTDKSQHGYHNAHGEEHEANVPFMHFGLLLFDIPDVQFYFPDLPVVLFFVDTGLPLKPCVSLPDLPVVLLFVDTGLPLEPCVSLPDLPVGFFFVGLDLPVSFLFLFPDLSVGLFFVGLDLPVSLFFVSLYLLFEPVAKGTHFPAHFQCGSRVLLMHYIFDVGNCQICHIFVDDVVALVRVVCLCCFVIVVTFCLHSYFTRLFQ